MKKIFNNKTTQRFLLFGSLTVGSLGSLAFVDDYFEISKNIEIFATVYREVNAYYVDDIDPAKFIKTGIDAMLNSLDPYTDYISEADVEDFRFQTTGLYGGIGALVTEVGGKLIITEPYNNSPAQKGGLMAGDEIVAVDGKNVVGKNADELGKFLKGQPKTDVKITVKRSNNTQPLTKSLIREEILVKNVPYYAALTPKIGYIKLDGFRQNCAKEVADAFEELKKQGIEQLVFDLRGNPGGSLDEAVRIVGFFVPKGSLVVDTRGKVKSWEKKYKSPNDPIALDMPVAVLVNEGSASASEVVSGTLQDYDRAVVVGQKTFGKGLVQTVRPLTFNTQVKITTAKYYTPSGRCIQAINYAQKDKNNMAQKFADSSKHAFKTKNGRTVFDADGIMPDLKVAKADLSSLTQTLYSKRLIFDFATQYRANNETIAPAKTFQLTQNDYQAFVEFVNKNNIKYETASEKLLEDYKIKAQKENYFEAVQAEYNQLKRKLNESKSKDIEKYKSQIVELLEDEIVSRYYFQNGRIQAQFDSDTELIEAIKILEDPKRYTAILTKN